MRVLGDKWMNEWMNEWMNVNKYFVIINNYRPILIDCYVLKSSSAKDA